MSTAPHPRSVGLEYAQLSPTSRARHRRRPSPLSYLGARRRQTPQRWRSLRRGRTETITDPWWSTSTPSTTAFAMPSSIAHTLIGRTPFASLRVQPSSSRNRTGVRGAFAASAPRRYPRKQQKSRFSCSRVALHSGTRTGMSSSRGQWALREARRRPPGSSPAGWSRSAIGFAGSHSSRSASRCPSGHMPGRLPANGIQGTSPAGGRMASLPSGRSRVHRRAGRPSHGGC
jgi:hypothetical protein